ncbi:spore germination protein [Paenibacillus senegalensis]|uniref:spore germination protein n=1 Tax=Paenibacillus senegalensis TaxID=1465766 RepID=UPI0002885ABB|nr:spore germination protein [Paenibacillus senegalensis]
MNMSRRFGKLMRRILLADTNRNQESGNKRDLGAESETEQLYASVTQNENQLRFIYNNCSDVIYRSFLIGGKLRALLVYIDGLTDTEGLDRDVLAPLMREESAAQDLEQLIDGQLSVSQVDPVSTFAQCMEYLSEGSAILLCDNKTTGFSLGMAKWEKRAIEEPQAEIGIKGPREGFTETLRISTSQLRRIIKSPLLKMETMRIGQYTRTNVVVTYIEGLADDSLVAEVKTRLSRIRIDGILESNYLEEMIEENNSSPFPQTLSTERPDVVSSCLLEGRVAILVEGSPFAIVVPVTFISLIQSQEDYYQRSTVSSIIRWLRYSFILLALLLPSVYVAVLTYHQEMVPGPLLISMASSREQVPFPALIEALMMEIVIEVLREAGVRLPKQVGAAVSIVGALVIGQASVQAGLVSAPMVIVVAITGIASFMIPRYATGIAIRLMRFPLIFLGGTLGLVGVMMGVIALFLHLGHLRSFGVPYLSDIASPKLNNWKDVLDRAPWPKMNTRPQYADLHHLRRQPPPSASGQERKDDN